MSPEMGMMLVNDVLPRLKAAANSVPKTGADDDEELTADMTLNAARMMMSAEQAGKSFTPGNIAYFASRAARSGRRSTGSSRTDVMSPGAQLDGLVRHEGLDAEFALGDETFDGPDTPHDVVWAGGCAGCTDPSEEAGRNLDWLAFIAGRPLSQRVAILVLAQGGTMREAGKRCGIGDSAASLLKKRLAEAIVEYFGIGDILHMLGGSRPAWEPDLRASRERHLCGATHACGRERAA